MSENRKITEAVTTIGIGTFLSRIKGFLRDMIIAYFFEAGIATDAFPVAFRSFFYRTSSKERQRDQAAFTGSG
jgi:peptidoglycan biosynthesis protein MviN/MurJ (putative lipid II flippase)